MLRACSLFLVCLLLDAPSAASPDPGLPAWLSGCWQMTRGPMTVDEQWLAPRGGLMLSAGRTVRDDTVLDYEFALLRVTPSGLSYEAHPSGQTPTTFRAVGGDTLQVVFENPSHDFPQRVGYRRTSPDSVLAWIEGVEAGQVRRIEFPYRRVDCRSRQP